MIIAFDNQVSLGQSLSAKGVAYITGTANSVLAFEDAGRPLTSNLANLTVNGSAIAVDRAYNGIVFSIVNANRTSTIFTCATGTTAQTTTVNDFESVTPEIRRLAALGYL